MHHNDCERCGDGMLSPALSFGWSSLQGLRGANEDYVGIRTGGPPMLGERGFVAALADGVGGHKGGRVAAEVTVRGFLDGYDAQRPLLGVRRNAGLALDSINRWVHAQGRQDPALEGMATTFSGLILHGGTAHWLQVGDSRIYRLREARLTRLTTDDVSDRPGQGHVLTRAVGLSAHLAVAYASEPIRAGDRYLLCSDGLHGVMADREIASVLGGGDAQRAADGLAQAGLEARSRDNVSVVVIDVEAVPPQRVGALAAALSELAPLADPRAGQSVDGFVLERALARTRLSAAFVALDRTGGLGRVVMKVPLGVDEAARGAVLREEWIGRQVRSPWLADSVALPDGRRQSLYAVQAYHPGETLAVRAARGGLSRAAGLSIGLRLGKAVAALHRAGVIHRDIKPENVQLEDGGGVRLLDLGAARLPGLDEDAGAAIAGLAGVPGTASYMAPELLDGGSAGDERTDLYALGVTLYRAWSGAYPYGEVEPFQRPRFGRAVPLSAHRPDLPAWLGAVLAQAVAVKPEDRQGDVLELVFALEHGAEMPDLSRPARVPLLERNPVRFWQGVAVVLAGVLVGVLVW